MATLSAETTVIRTVSEIPLRPIMTLMVTGKDRLTAILIVSAIRRPPIRILMDSRLAHQAAIPILSAIPQRTRRATTRIRQYGRGEVSSIMVHHPLHDAEADRSRMG